MTQQAIKFGTSGHRGIIARDFTGRHVKAIAQAVATYTQSLHKDPVLVIGYDPRTGNSPQMEEGSYTQLLVKALIEQGISVWFCDTFTPTPVVSWMIEAYQLQGGLILTASHNPPNYNGIKFNPSDGAPAPTSITENLESLANQYFNEPKSLSVREGRCKKVYNIKEFASSLFKKTAQTLHLKNLVMPSTPVFIDCNYGATGEVWEQLLSECMLQDYTILNKTPLPDFNMIDPNPSKEENLNRLRARQKEAPGAIAFANDPDGDRHVILDEDGQVIRPGEFSAMLIQFLHSRKIPVHGVATTVASSSIIKSACIQHQLNYAETRVGFKFFTPFLKQSRKSGKLGLAVESSGGFSWSAHTLEKCGFLPCLIALILIKETGKTLSELKAQAWETYGRYYFTEDAWVYPIQNRPQIVQHLEELSLARIGDLFGEPIEKITKLDGAKIHFSSGNWVLTRLSGTEPLARFYAEANSPEKSLDLAQKMKTLLQS